MKNRTIAKLLVCSTVLANLPVAAMANEVQTLAADNNVWSNEGKDWTYTLNSDTNLWGNEEGTYELDSDSTYKILFDTAVNVGLDSNVKTDGTTSKLTIEGKSAAESNFNLNGHTITGDVTFKNVNVVGTVDRANTYVDETVTVNQMAVVTVTGAGNVTITNGSGDFANGAGLALVGDTLTVTPDEGYRIDTLKGLTPVVVGSDSDQYTVNGAVEITVVPEDQPVDPTYITSTVNITGNGKVTYTIAGDTTVYDVVEGKLTAEEGKEVTLKAEAAEGNELKSVTIYGEAKDTAGTYTFTVAEGVISVEFAKQTAPETDVWEKQEDGTYVLDITKLTGTELVVPESTATYIIKSGTELGVTDVKVGKGSILRIERGATFTQDVDFALGGRLIAQTTTFKGQVWFTSYTSMARTASATTDGTAVVDGATFEKAVTISVPTELTGTTKANAEVAVVSGAALTVSGTVEGQGSITSQGDLTVSGTVSTPVTVQAGTVNVTGTVPTIEVTGTASVTVAETANVDKIVIAESAGNVAIDAPSVPVEDNRKNGITYTVSVTGKGTLRYGANTLVNDTDSTQTKTVYAVADDTAVQLIMEPAEGYNFESLKVNDVAVETTKNTQGFDTYSVQQDANLKSIAATFVDGFIGGGGGSTGGGSTGGGSSTSGTTSTVTVSASTSVSGKIMTATVSASNMEKAVKDVLALAEKNNTTPVVKVSLSLGTSVEGISVNLPTEALKALAAVSNAKLTIESSVASVTFDANALSDVLSQAGETFTLNAGKADMSNFTAAQLLGAGEGSVYDINITSDGNAITNFDGGSATVTLPYALKVGENASDIVVYYMADNGILDSQSTQYDAANRKATFTTSHFSIYVVDAAWANPFNDVYEGDWFYNAVRYANENSLMAGVSDTTFAPNMNLTRAMVVQMLYSLEGKPAVVSGGNFSDVKASDWYADAVNWAASKGIVSGYSETTYAPNDSVTREQLSLILYKYAQSKNVTVNDYSSLSGFVDAAKTSDWAEDAVEWAVGAGLISSTSTSTKTLDPTGTATRAQVAQIVANFVEQVM